VARYAFKWLFLCLIKQKQNAMKATINFKATILTVATIFSSYVFGQNNEAKVWVSFENKASVPVKNERGVLTSSNVAMNELISKHTIKSVDRPFSNSRKAELNEVVELTCACDQNSLMNDLTSKGRLVKRVEKAPVFQTLDMPNDYNTVFGSDYALDLINANAAWEVTHGNSEIRIGVSDQNFYAEHEELAGKFNYYDATNTAVKTHGTAVAITAAGNTNNAIGKSSIGFNSSLALYRMNYNDVLAASYAGCKVVNLSWASGCSYNPYVQAALDEVYANGTFIVASAGNGTTCGAPANLVYPAAYQHVFAVSSIGQNNNHERTIGNPSTTHQHNASVDLCAPGYDVPLSTAPGSYTLGNGSSFAAPYVSGTVALMMAVNPCLSNNDIEYILKQTAFNLDALNPSYAGLLGAGRLDAAAAVNMAKDYNKLVLSATVNAGCDPNAGAITIDITGGVAPYSILWNNGDTTATINNLSEGTYSAVVTDASNCRVDSLTVSLSYPTLSLIATIFDESATGANDGSIDITFTGDSVNSYQWNNGATTEDINGLTGGEYSLNLQTASGCPFVKTFFVSTFVDTTSNSSVSTDTTNTDNGNDTTVVGDTTTVTDTTIVVDTTVGDDTTDNGNDTTVVDDTTNNDDNQNNNGGNNGNGNNGNNGNNNNGNNNGESTKGNKVHYNKNLMVLNNSGFNTINSTADQIEIETFELTVYPNPTTEHAIVKWNGNAKSINVLNTNGQVILKQEINQMAQINLENLTAGVYHIQVSDFQNNIHTQKLIVQ